MCLSPAIPKCLHPYVMCSLVCTNNTSYLIAWKFIEFYFFAITLGRYGTILKFNVQFFSFWCKKCRSWSSILLCDGCCTMGAWIFRILMVKRAYVRRYYFCFTWPASFKFLTGLYIFICADMFFPLIFHSEKEYQWKYRLWLWTSRLASWVDEYFSLDPV